MIAQYKASFLAGVLFTATALCFVFYRYWTGSRHAFLTTRIELTTYVSSTNMTDALEFRVGEHALRLGSSLGPQSQTSAPIITIRRPVRILNLRGDRDISRVLARVYQASSIPASTPGTPTAKGQEKEGE